MIITVCLNPALDKTISVDCLSVGGVNRIAASRLDPGGKAINVSKIVRILGGETLAIGVIGGESGAYIRSRMDAMGIPHDFVEVEAPTRTNYKIADRVLHQITECNEIGSPVSEETLREVWERISRAVKPGDAVVFAGKNPPGMANDRLAQWISALKSRGVFTALDTVGEPMRLGIQAHPDVIKPNQSELSELFGEPLHYIRDIFVASRQIVQQGVESVVVSLGSEGALFVTHDEILRGYGLNVPVGSTVGSGDAMLAAVVYYLQQGCSWTETARRSIATSAANVMQDGTQPPTLSQIEELVDRVQIEKM